MERDADWTVLRLTLADVIMHCLLTCTLFFLQLQSRTRVQTQIHCCMNIEWLAARLLAVRLLAVRLLAVRLLAARLLAVRLLALRLLAVRLLAARLLAARLLAVRLLAVRLLAARLPAVRLPAHTAACTYCCTRLRALTRHTLAAHCSLHARLMTLLALLTPFMLSLLHAGRFNCCYRSVRVRLVLTHRIFASLTAAQHDHSVLTAFRPVRASTTPAQHSSSKARSAGGWPKPAAILKFNFKFTNGRRPL